MPLLCRIFLFRNSGLQILNALNKMITPSFAIDKVVFICSFSVHGEQRAVRPPVDHGIEERKLVIWLSSMMNRLPSTELLQLHSHLYHGESVIHIAILYCFFVFLWRDGTSLLRGSPWRTGQGPEFSLVIFTGIQTDQTTCRICTFFNKDLTLKFSESLSDVTNFVGGVWWMATADAGKSGWERRC